VIQRIIVMERDLVLPLKTAGIAMLLYSFFFSSSSWMNHVLGELEIAVESTQYIFGIYIIINIAFAALLLNIRKVSPLVTNGGSHHQPRRWHFRASLTLVTGGPDSVLYWISSR